MAKTAIEWADTSWNPILGCARVSPGCDRCYAITQARMRAANPHPKVAEAFAGLTERTAARLDWTGRVNLRPERLAQPCSWRSPRRVFVNSLSDLFHEAVPDGFIARIWDVMGRCPQHTFMILTKRHARMRSWARRWADRAGDGSVGARSGLPPMPRGPQAMRASAYTSGRARLFADMLDSMGAPPEGCAYPLYDWMEGWRFWPGELPNVWLGVSCEDQHWADIRIPALLYTPAAIRWISAEPLLGPVDLHWCGGIDALERDWAGSEAGGTGAPHPLLDWVVAGGESGPGARPMETGWARSLRDQCQAAGVPFFFKQWGEWAPVEPDDWRNRRETDSLIRLDGRHWPLAQPHGAADGAEVTIRRAGKKAAGRVLDGRTWDEFPAGAVTSGG
jgi:protein gp37